MKWRMSTMSEVEAVFSRSAPWRGFARRFVLPLAVGGRTREGTALEIGGGSGAMAEQLLESHPHLRITVVDIDPAMTATAQQRLRRFGDRAASLTADVSALPYPDQSFDLVLSWLMLHHTITWEDALAEARRVLRAGGTLVGYDQLDTVPARFIHRIDRSEHRHPAKQRLELPTPCPPTPAAAPSADCVRLRSR
jgi:ubiquinone/menaquinone biosynthesis C-methylase UbiE